MSVTILASFPHVLRSFLPRLSGAQLAEARRRTGRLGGRPRRVTHDDAREAVLQRLMPKALKVLEAKIEANDKDCWRAAIKLIEHGWGRPTEQIEVRADEPVESMSLDQLRELRDRLLREYPALAQPGLVE